MPSFTVCTLYLIVLGW